MEEGMQMGDVNLGQRASFLEELLHTISCRRRHNRKTAARFYV
jgi:hypothetical protein